MIIDHVDQRTVRSALELAVRAPSVHNSQPWRFVLGPRSVHLYADMRRWLPATDADGRDLVVSCGIVLHHLRIALAAAGIGASVHRMPNPDQPDHLAAVALRPGAPADADLGLAGAITRRRTDRRRFTDWEVPEGFVQELGARAADQGALLRPVDGRRERALLLAAIRDAAAAQEDDTAYRTETAVWSGCIADDTGVPASNLLRDPIAPVPVRRAASPRVSSSRPTAAGRTAPRSWCSAPPPTMRSHNCAQARRRARCCCTPPSWGLATCPLSQPLEVDAARIAVRDAVLGGTLCPQLVLRVGWAPVGPELPPTPRLPIERAIERTRS